MFCECRLSDIIREQYYIAKYVNISLSDSECIPLFEKDAYVEFILQDIQKEKNSLNTPT